MSWEPGHHVWCNGQIGPVRGCMWCDPKGDGTEGLWALYPYDRVKDNVFNLHKKYFPNVKRIDERNGDPNVEK